MQVLVLLKMVIMGRKDTQINIQRIRLRVMERLCWLGEDGLFGAQLRRRMPRN